MTIIVAIMSVAVRKIEPADFAAAGNLLTQLGYPQTNEEIAQGCSAAGTTVFVAELDGNVVGLLALNIRRSFQYVNPIAEVDVMVVDETVRSKGVGSAMITFAAHYAKEKNCFAMELHSNVRREDAHRFYEREGFVATSKYFIKKLAG